MADSLLVLRIPSGLSGDMFLAGLARMNGLDQDGLALPCQDLNLPEMAQAAKLEPRSVQGLAGWGLAVDLPQTHNHRHLSDIAEIIAASRLSPTAKELSLSAFTLLAQAEAHVHGLSPDEVHFHEVGALDSILDVCLSCALFDRLAPSKLICGPLPVCDGVVRCEHGLLSTPAPATMYLLTGLPVVGLASQGETLTPTALCLLKTFKAEFGPWPAMIVEKQERIYGSRTLPGVPNGAIFAHGHAHDLL